jgi:Flp pilus assembly protein TadD
MGGRRSWRGWSALGALTALAAAAGLTGCALFAGSALSKEEKQLDPRYRAVLEAQKARTSAAPSRTPAETKESFEEKLAKGDRLRSAGQEKEALFSYLAAVRMRPGDPAPRERIGLLHLREDPERSEAIFRGVLQKEPESVSALTGLGLALLAQDRAGEARAPLERAVELDPESALALSALGIVCDRLGDPASGMHYQRLAAERRPGDPSILNNLGASCLLDGDLECAEGAFREALLLDPQDPTLHNNLGLALARQRRYADALDAFRKGGSERAALNNLGWGYYLNGDYGGAVAQYEKALLVQGDDELTVRVLDNLKLALGAREKGAATAAAESTPARAAADAPAASAPAPAVEPTPASNEGVEAVVQAPAVPATESPAPAVPEPAPTVGFPVPPAAQGSIAP